MALSLVVLLSFKTAAPFRSCLVELSTDTQTPEVLEVPVKIVKTAQSTVLSHVVDMTRKGFKCVEVASGEYRCTKRINEIQEYTIILLSSPG